VGEIHTLMQRVGGYASAVLYQTVHALEDSFDYEGMVAAGARHSEVSQALEGQLRETGAAGYLHLSAGGCRLCETCAKRENQPCHHPALALPSMESYGVNVYETARRAGLLYINGQDSVTYFGMVLFGEGSHANA
jgi:predicted metal-binding protein